MATTTKDLSPSVHSGLKSSGCFGFLKIIKKLGHGRSKRSDAAISVDKHAGDHSSSFASQEHEDDAALDEKKASLNAPHPSTQDFEIFAASYPSYQSQILDALRLSDFSRLDAQNSTYVDYTGSALYPASLISFYTSQLQDGVFGNPHSTNPASMAASAATKTAKDALLDFLDADKQEYDVVWTQNASGAMRIIGEGFDYGEGGRLLLGVDSHNSVNGMRAFAEKSGAKVDYLSFKNNGQGLSPPSVSAALSSFSPTTTSHGLFVLTGQSNVTGLKAPLSLLAAASSAGYNTFLDAAALLPTSRLSLRSVKGIDALSLSVYKLFGFPTGVGALVIRCSVLEGLKKPWFSGGSVSMVQVPGNVVTLEKGAERFMDGTTDFLSMLPIPKGLDILASVMPEMGRRLPTLVLWTVAQMQELKHDNGEELVAVRSPKIGIKLEELKERYGALIAFEILDDEGNFVSSDVVEFGAGKQGICIRAGCMCNPGGSAVLMGTEFLMANIKPGDTKKTAFASCGERAAGLCRASFGMSSNFQDAWTLIQYLKTLTVSGRIQRLRNEFWDRDREITAC
ncbi:PLP-dependent transferase [Atractiella rhizophila]|nr:PLP-dependent transferase [Atractiella rhizophila]